jgi:hypothetical protein
MLDGCEVDAVRLSLNGSTHVLGLKEALRNLAGESSYPFVSGVSSDAFWIAYYLRTEDLGWGGIAREVLRRGLVNFGFSPVFLDEVEEDAAWNALRGVLDSGATVITPLYVGATTLLGTGFAGAEWVYVTGVEDGDVLVNCMLGDGMRFSEERFRAGWCMHHPLEESAEDLPIVYAMCVIGERERTPTQVELVHDALRSALEVMHLAPSDKVVAFGFDAYAQLVDDLSSHTGPEDVPPDEARAFLPWLGLGILHLHGSRWAVRDFIGEVIERGDLEGSDREALLEAHDLYDRACGALQRFLELMPWTLDLDDPAERADAIRHYNTHRDEGADLLRLAAAQERDALERFRAILSTDSG